MPFDVALGLACCACWKKGTLLDGFLMPQIHEILEFHEICGDIVFSTLNLKGSSIQPYFNSS